MDNSSFSIFSHCYRPNILLIMTDQHQAEALSIAGNANLNTPNLDKLAKQGVRFENAYVTFPHSGSKRPVSDSTRPFLILRTFQYLRIYWAEALKLYSKGKKRRANGNLW